MTHPDKQDWEMLDEYLKVFSTLSQDFIAGLGERKVGNTSPKMAQLQLSEHGVGFSDSVEYLRKNIIPQLSASRGPRYWGFVTGGATPVATFADWLVSTFDQNVAAAGDSIATEVERQVIDWIKELFDLPDEFNGIETTGATASNFLGSLCARQFAGQQQAIDVARSGVYGLSIEVFSATPHASMNKSLGMAGLGQDCITRVNSLANTEIIDIIDLENKMSRSHAKAKIVIASAGTVTATDFDQLVAVRKVVDQYEGWLHVDAAFGLFERLVAGEDTLTKGIEFADSITVDCHKWLNVPYDSALYLTRHGEVLSSACHVAAPYLDNEFQQPDFMSLGIENSRRFRALPIWMSLLAYGKQGVASWVANNIRLAKKFAQLLNESADYELMLECKLNVVLFRPDCVGLTDAESDQKTTAFLSAINRDGRVFVSPGLWQGRKIIRAALSNWETCDEDIQVVMECLRDVTSKI